MRTLLASMTKAHGAHMYLTWYYHSESQCGAHILPTWNTTGHPLVYPP